MTSTQQRGVSSNRVRDVWGVNIDHLECSICHDVLWKSVACQSCETPFCSACINQWLANNSNKCPNRCATYTERKCPPFIAKLLAELQITCFYQSNGCQQVLSYEALDKHEIACGFQTQKCPGCRLKILKKDFETHKNQCASINLTCEDCKLVYKRGNAATKHTENICLKEQLRQVRDESKKNKLEMHALTVQLYELCMLDASLSKTKITFEDLPSAAEEPKTMPSIYRGLKWIGLAYVHESYLKTKLPNSGFVTAFAPGCSPHMAYFIKDASIDAESPNETFTFVSLVACAALNDDLQLTITGYRNSVQINADTITLLFGQPQHIPLRWENIDKITFKPFGGTAHPGSGSGSSLHVIITQLTIIASH